MREQTTLRKNPSRETCEGIIKRILITEVLEHGSNRHFKTASDFMNYFESLYPASDALTKQVQRAIKAMDMPKDDRGFLIVNKTTDQFKQEKELTNLFQQANVTIHPMDQIETIFLSAAPYARTHMIHLLETSDIFRDKYLIISNASNGLLIYTEDKNRLLGILNSLTIQPLHFNVILK